MDGLINSLHAGMNLRDADHAMAPGETGVTIGCDFSVPGQVTPLRQASVFATYASDVQDAHIVYLSGTRYTFTTHAGGLRANNVLIDASFTGTFKVLPINDEYVVLSNGTYQKKWKPGWASTYDWGLNTPPLPTLSAGALTSKDIETFEVLTSWTFTGGGAGGALAADTVQFQAGTQSMKLTCDAGQTIMAKRVGLPLDLSQFLQAGDLGVTPYISIYYYTATLKYVQNIKIKLSCAADGEVDKDFYGIGIDLGGYDAHNLQLARGGYNSILAGGYEDFSKPADSSMPIFPEAYDPTVDPATTWVTVKDTTTNKSLQVPSDLVGQTGGVSLQAGQDIEIGRWLIQAPKKETISINSTWTLLKVPLSHFERHGTDPDRDWSTISGIHIEVTAVTGQAIISFDKFQLLGGGNLHGYYWLAAAYQNELGNYGPFSDFAGPVFLECQDLEVSGLTVDSDPQTTKRRLALLGGSLTMPMVCYLNDNTSSSTTVENTDASLTQVETNFYNRKPVGCRDMVEAGGRIFLVSAEHPNRIIYSEPFHYEAFPWRNYHLMAEGEDFYQIAVMGEAIAARGKGQEYLLYLSGETPAFWQRRKGAREGAVNSRLLLEVVEGQVFASEKGLFISSGGAGDYYLPKINPAINDMSAVLGAMAGKKAYLTFTDTDAVSRLMRIDYSLGAPVAHYVANLAPAAVFADKIAGKVYYALGNTIYELEGGTSPLATEINIIGLYLGTRRLKDFAGLSYELADGPLTLTLTLDREVQAGSYSLADAEQESDPASLPPLQGRRLAMKLVSTTQDYTLYLPWELVAAEVGL